MGGKLFLGIELGSTRIKSVLIDEKYEPVAAGAYDWENSLDNGIWTYSLDLVWEGLKECVKNMSADVTDTGVFDNIAGIGISAMMHGYLVFDKNGKQLVPFRTWRNTTTEKSAALLTELFNFNVPQRWSIAHLYQAILDNEAHVPDIAYITTLAGYVHYKLTGKRVIGIDDASGMFPINSEVNNFDGEMLDKFDMLVKDLQLPWKIRDILPKVLTAGEDAGQLTEEGAKLLDAGNLIKAGIPLCPPEGDAGTGMVATNSIKVKTGNVSAGTSIFAMLVLEKELSKLHIEIDMVTTPTGKPVAMVHCNTFTSDLDAWVKLFGEAMALMGFKADKSALYESLYKSALLGDADCGGLLSYNYLAGEPTTGFDQGRPLFARMPDSNFTINNFMRNLLFSSIATLKIGMDIIIGEEKVAIEKLLGHGGFFKTPEVGQKIMASALSIPVAVMESSGEGGAWGIALLAAYMVQKQPKESLENFLDAKVFANIKSACISPDAAITQGFNKYMELYKPGLEIMRAAVTHFI